MAEGVGFTQPHCRTKRSDTLSAIPCVKLSHDIAGQLTLPNRGIDQEILKYKLLRDAESNFIFKDIKNGNEYLLFKKRFYLIKRLKNKNFFRIYLQEKNGWRNLFRRKGNAWVDVFYSVKKGTLYPATRAGYLQESLNLSAAGAKLYLFSTEKISSTILRPEEISALTAYGSNNYDAVNDFLRQGSPKQFISPWVRESAFKQATLIEQALDKLPPYPGVVFRGSVIRKGLIRTINQGDVLTSIAFISTSADRAVASQFARSSAKGFSPVIYTIYVKKAGRPVMLYTRQLDECEVLLQRNSFFKVIKRGNRAISLREIPLKKVRMLQKKQPASRVFDFLGNRVNLPPV